jgi:hypothetical protein
MQRTKKKCTDNALQQIFSFVMTNSCQNILRIEFGHTSTQTNELQEVRQEIHIGVNLHICLIEKVKPYFRCEITK